MATLPAEFKINSFDIRDDQSYVQSFTRSKRLRQRKTVGQAYIIDIRSVELQQSDLRKVMAGISAIERDNDTIQLPLATLTDSTAPDTIVQQTIDQGDKDGSFDNVAGVEVGDFFNFDNHQKAYQVTSIDGNFVNFTPNLVTPVPLGTGVTFNGATFSVKISARPQRYSVNADRNSAEVGLTLTEVF